MIPTAHEFHLRGCMAFCTMLLVAFGCAVLFVAYETRADWTSEVAPPPGYAGDVKRGEERFAQYGCTSCHALGDTAPRGEVGPPLDHIATRSYIAGHFANNEIWMTQWIEHPPALKPGTAMPDLGVSRRDALDIAAYLATMK